MKMADKVKNHKKIECRALKNIFESSQYEGSKLKVQFVGTLVSDKFLRCTSTFTMCN